MGTLEAGDNRGRSAAGTAGPRLFPVTCSILAADALRAEVAQAYAIGMPVTCQLLRPGTNDTYILTTRDNRYIARVYRAHRRSLADISYELDLLAHLAAKGVSVSVPLAGKDDNLIRPLAAPEGTRHLVLFSYADGKPLSWNETDDSYLAGWMAATIHAASGDFVSRHSRDCLDLRSLIDIPLAAIRPFLTHRPEDWSYLKELAARLRARIEAAARIGLDWGVCHGDFGARNIHIGADRRPTVFDFDRCGPGWRAFDFALIQWGAMNQTNAGMWDSFMKGYTDTRQLAAANLAAAPLFHASCRLMSLGLRAERIAEWGTLCITDSLLDAELMFFQEWETKHL